MANRMNRYLRVGLQPGIFGSEYTVVLNVHGREIFSTVPKTYVRVSREPSNGNDGEGLLGVSLVQSDGPDAIVDLPTEAFTSEPRLRVPANALME
jgi:hypothetical protein